MRRLGGASELTDIKKSEIPESAQPGKMIGPDELDIKDAIEACNASAEQLAKVEASRTYSHSGGAD